MWPCTVSDCSTLVILMASIRGFDNVPHVFEENTVKYASTEIVNSR